MNFNKDIFEKFELRKEQYHNQKRSAEAKKKQHAKGKLTAWERISILFDKDTFTEIDKHVLPVKSSFGKGSSAFGDGVITGVGMVMGAKDLKKYIIEKRIFR